MFLRAMVDLGPMQCALRGASHQEERDPANFACTKLQVGKQPLPIGHSADTALWAAFLLDGLRGESLRMVGVVCVFAELWTGPRWSEPLPRTLWQPDCC
mmetsp:Transcript_139273/g.445240  ORF Transcript_139273/g.445240 Transcript_139273/m.445240 type:complete len:99 (-) Transcript_139273:3938-4234(-)